VATLTGREKDELVGEDLKQHRRLRQLTVSAIVLLVVLTVASALAAVWATWQMDKAVAREWVATSVSSEAADPELSVLMAAPSFWPANSTATSPSPLPPLPEVASSRK
jgi:hypothetical protein